MAAAMEFTVEYGSGPPDLTITLSGEATAAELRRYNAELRADPRFRGGLTILVDASALDTTKLKDGELEAARDSLADRDWAFPPLAIAALAPDPQTFADMRLGQAHLGGSSASRRTFKSRKAAVTWLRAMRRSDP